MIKSLKVGVGSISYFSSLCVAVSFAPPFPSVCLRLRMVPFDDFDPVLNHHCLQECLHKLLYMYALNGGMDRKTQLEFAVYFMLNHLGMCLGLIS